MKKALILVLLIISALAFSVEYATTDDGERVLLYSDGTWEYVETKDEWQTVFRVDGSSTKETKQFEITSNDWRVKVDFSGTVFYLWLRDKEGKLIERILSMNEPGHESVHLSNPGIYSLRIISSDSYEIIIEQKIEQVLNYEPEETEEYPNIKEIIFEGDIVKDLRFNMYTPSETVMKAFEAEEYERISEELYIVPFKYWEDKYSGCYVVYTFSDGLFLDSIMIGIPVPKEKEHLLVSEYYSIQEAFENKFGEPYYEIPQSIAWFNVYNSTDIFLGYYEAEEMEESESALLLISLNRSSD